MAKNRSSSLKTASRRRTRPETSVQVRERHLVSERFEESTTQTLQAQDALLERMEKRLDAKVLNGGFDDLMTKVVKIELIQEQFKSTQDKNQVKTDEKLDSIHNAIYEPDSGLYAKVKSNAESMAALRKIFKGFVALVASGLVGGAGKLLYDYIASHI